MKYQILYLFKLFLVVIVMFAGVANSAEREDLLKLGKTAYKSQDYVTALKNLYAFYILNENNIEKYPNIKNSILEKIKKSEAILILSFASNNNVNIVDGNFTLKTKTIDRGFTGTGKEIDDLLMNKSINLDMMKQQRNLIYRAR